MLSSLFYKRFFIECDLGDKTLKEILKSILLEDIALTDIKFSLPSKKQWAFQYYTKNEISENYLVITTIRDKRQQIVFVKYEKDSGITVELQIGNMAYFYITFSIFGFFALGILENERSTEYMLLMSLMVAMIGIHMIMPLSNAETIADDIKTQLHIAGIKYHPQIGNLK
ncbi:MAG: hypothetical protein AB8F74_14265 [Saprospiraceae bacterium]